MGIWRAVDQRTRGGLLGEGLVQGHACGDEGRAVDMSRIGYIVVAAGWANVCRVQDRARLPHPLLPPYLDHDRRPFRLDPGRERVPAVTFALYAGFSFLIIVSPIAPRVFQWLYLGTG